MKGTQGLFRLGVLAFGLALMVLVGCDTDSPDDGGDDVPPVTAMPTASPVAGEVAFGQEIILATTTAGAVYVSADKRRETRVSAAQTLDSGKDGDPRIQILVYDLNNDRTGGYFGSIDYYDDAYANSQWGYRSNEAEIIGLNVGSVDRNGSYTYSSLAHEFQHMINFNVKLIKNGG